MFETLNIGCTPYAEECEALGPNYNAAKARRKCFIFRDQLIRQFGHPPTNARLLVVSNPHDFGTYLEVSVKFDVDDDEAVNYAYKLESETPEHWDEEAKKEISKL
jgi:hypothetical protein